jgi:Fic family protein
VKEDRRYDYSFIKDLRISAGTVSLMSRIEVFRSEEKERKKAHPNIFTALESVARIQSVKGSNEIEGIVTTDARLEEIVNRNSAPLNHSEMEIAGYRDVLDMIHREHDSIGLSEDLIKNMHRIMMLYTPRGGGSYKKQDNLIVNIDDRGVRSIRFVPLSSKDTPKAMEQLILAYMDAKDDAGIEPLILIPCFILDFLCIHPFSDGNGRMSRLLTLLLMYKSGIDAGKYISFEGRINENKSRYYEALRRSSEGWHTNGNDYIPFMEDFLFTLFSCYNELDRRFEVIGDKKVNKGNRIEAAVMNSIAPLSKRELIARLPDISPTTIEAKLSDLQKQEKIIKIGGRKDARYVGKQ